MKILKVVENKKIFTLELNEEEVKFIYAICGMVSGCAKSRRKYADKFRDMFIGKLYNVKYSDLVGNIDVVSKS